MYRVLIDKMIIARSKLEGGDPPMGCVFGQLIGIGDVRRFAENLIDLGAIDEDGEFRLELTQNCRIEDDEGNAIPYSGACLMAYPEIDEAVIDIVGVPYPEYERLFPNHVKAYEAKYKNT